MCREHGGRRGGPRYLSGGLGKSQRLALGERQLLGALKLSLLAVATVRVTSFLVVSTGVTPILVQCSRGDVNVSVTLALAFVEMRVPSL